MDKNGGSDVSSGSIPYKLMLTCPTGLPPSQVSVMFDKSYDRIPHPNVDLENSIAQYGGHTRHKSEGDEERNTRVCLHLGLTDYRSLSPSLPGQIFTGHPYETLRCQHTSNPMGNGAIVETSDGRIILLKRSNNVGEFPGHFVFPGGHPEPKEIGIVSHGTSDKDLLCRKVAEEMFDSIIREVVEETGVPTECLSQPVFIGISRREFNVRPAAFFYMKCTLRSTELQKLYGSAQDGFESTQLYAVTKIINSLSPYDNCLLHGDGVHDRAASMLQRIKQKLLTAVNKQMMQKQRIRGPT